MKIRKVTIKNLNSLRLTATIHFDESPLRDTGLFAITGDTGAGKTTILDAITLSLYGQIHRNKEVQEVMSYGATESLAEVEFDNDKDRFRAKWTIWRAHNKVDGNIQPPRREVSRWNPEKKDFEIIAEKVREADQVIEEVTGLDYDRFTRSVLLAQGDFAAFLQASEKDRSDLLERITGTAVYTRLSQASFERHKEEMEKLQGLQRQREVLQVLSEEEITELEQQLEARQEQIEARRKQLEQSRTDLLWVTQLQELEQRRTTLLDQMKVIETEKEEMAGDLQRLKQFQRVRPFEARLNRLDDLSQSIEELNKEKIALEEKLEAAEQQLDAAKKTQQDQEKSLREARRILEEKRPLFEEVIQVDIAIQEKEAPLEKSCRSLNNLRESEKKLLETRKHKQEQQKKLQARLEELQQWLKENKQLEGLQDDLSGMEQLANRWWDKQQEANLLTGSQKKIQQEFETKRQALQQLEKQIAQLGEEQMQLEQEFRNFAPENYTASRSELLELVGGEIERLRERGQQLEQLVQLSEEYRALLQRLDQHETELEDLMGQELTLNKSLMTAMEVLEILDKALEYRQEIHQQQLMIANYEQDRQRLGEGEPCPLCFSREHPFRKEEIKPFVDETRQELDRAAKKRDKAHRRYLELLKGQSEIAARMEQLAGDEQQLKGRRRELQERIEQYEVRIVKSTPILGDELLRIGQVDILRGKLSEAQQLIAARRENRARLQEIHQKLEKADKKLRLVQEEYASGNTALKVLEQKSENLREQAEERRREAGEAREAFRLGLKQYGYELEDEDPGDLIGELRHRKEEFVRRREAAAQTAQDLRLAKQEAQQVVQNLKQLKEAIREADREVTAASDALQQLRDQRRERFGEQAPREERAKLEQQISEAENQLEAAQKTLAEVQLEQQRIVALIQQKGVDIHKNQKRIAELEKTLTADLREANMESIQEARAALLRPDEVRILEQRRTSLERREVETRKALLDKEVELKDHLKEQPAETSETALTARIKSLDEELGTMQQASGAIRERLEANVKRENEARILIEKIDQQGREYARWAKLNDVIGSADGKKFRIFAQGLTLSRLVRLANQHLQNLNGRYIIRKRHQEDLGLEIIDSFQADNIRSMNTLSGGESFLVSLALALGLSDLAGQQTNIRSLFIDEGFGTLDENSLDLAIATLENLQAGGKTIGIISHVKELKERIGVQIQVKNRGNGFSDMEIVG